MPEHFIPNECGVTAARQGTCAGVAARAGADVARELGVTRQAIQKMMAIGQDGPRR
jgi:hypothetical protein